MLLSSLQDAYRVTRRREGQLSDNTLHGWLSNLSAFRRWLAETGIPDPTEAHFSPYLLNAYRDYLRFTRQNRPATVKGCFSALRNFGAFLVESGALKDNPAASVQMPKADAPQREYCSDDETTALLDACRRQKDAKQVALSRCLLAMLAYAALRLEVELLQLRLSDLDLKEGRLTVRNGKGGKARSIFMRPELRQAVCGWLDHRPDCRADWLFAYSATKRYSVEGLREIFHAVRHIAGLGHRRLTPHCLRHNCASRMLRNGASLKAIQEFLGHGSMETTYRYLHGEAKEQRELPNFAALPGVEETPAPVKKLTRIAAPARPAPRWKVERTRP